MGQVKGHGATLRLMQSRALPMTALDASGKFVPTLSSILTRNADKEAAVVERPDGAECPIGTVSMQALVEHSAKQQDRKLPNTITSKI